MNKTLNKGFIETALIVGLAVATIGAIWFLKPTEQVVVEVPVEVPSQTFGAFNTVGGTNYFLHGGGIGTTDTSVTLTDFDVPVAGTNLSMSDFGTIGYLTIEPGSATRQEFVSFTGVTQNADDTATLTGVTRGLSPVTPYTASSTLQKAHPGGSIAVLSNPPQLYEQFGTLANDEAITGQWTAPTPLAGAGIATKDYVDDNVSGGAVTDEAVVVAGVAGETVTTGQIVYMDTTDNEWKLADASVVGTSVNVLLGVAQGAGTNGNAITGGVLLHGTDRKNLGGTAGNTIYISDTSGATSTSAGTIQKRIGIIKDADEFYFDPFFTTDTVTQSDNTFIGTNTFSTTTTFTATSTVSIGDFPAWEIGKNISIITTTGTSTWAVPSGVNKIFVELVGAGGGGGSPDGGTEVGSGGGSGGYSNEIVDVSATSTIQVHVGAGGAEDSAGARTTFGTIGNHFLTATGGSGGSDPSASLLGGSPGVGENGDVNLTGSAGGTGSASATGGSGFGAPSFFGGGGRPVAASNGGVAGTSFGSGGSGGNQSNSGGAGAAGVIIIRW